jgi:adenylate cyclase
MSAAHSTARVAVSDRSVATRYDADFDRGVELRFSVHPAVRAATDLVHCIGGPLRVPHIAAQQYLRAGEERSLVISPTEPLHLRTVGSTQRLSIRPGQPKSRVGTVKLTYADGRWVAPHSLLQGDCLELPEGTVLSLRNQTGGAVLAVLEDAASLRKPPPRRRSPRCRSSVVCSLPRFWLPASSTRSVTSRSCSVTSRARRGYMSGIGDAAAYSRVNRHFDFIRETVTRLDGTAVKTLGDGVMCAFQQLDDALEAALTVQEQVTRWGEAQAIDPPLVLKLGVHVGPVIAMTANDRLDYFGRTVNVAARLGDQSRGGDVVLLADVSDELAVTRPGWQSDRFTCRLRGLDGEQHLVRLRPEHADSGIPRRAPPETRWRAQLRGRLTFKVPVRSSS